jgi:uncharacterized peroxidase-related enzyme
VGDRDDWIAAVAQDWRSAPLDAVDRALCGFAETMTLASATMTARDLEPLRAVGLDDRAIHDAAQTIGLFNYLNRLSDALGVDPEDWMPELPGCPPA